MNKIKKINMGAVLADFLLLAPSAWNKEFTEKQKQLVKNWWKGPNYSFNNSDEKVQKIVELFEKYTEEK